MDIRGPSQFLPDGDASTVSVNWDSWLEEFEAFADSKGLFNLDGAQYANKRSQRKALLLYHAGSRVREIHSTLDQTGRDQYDEMVALLNAHFHVEPNVTYQRHMFRQCFQNEKETVSQYCARLLKLVTHCDYGDANAVNNQVRDQIVEGCHSDELREKLLEEGNGLTLEILLQRAATHEAVEQRAKAMSRASAINRVASGSTARSNESFRSYGPKGREEQAKCEKCGLEHKPRQCPAYGKTCHKCGNKHHYARMCRGAGYRQNPSNSRRRVNNVNEDVEMGQISQDTGDEGTETRFAFYMPLVCNNSSLERRDIIVGGVTTSFIIDTGSDCNVISQKTYEHLKASKFKVRDSQCGGNKILPYTAKVAIQPIGVFWCDIELKNSDARLDNVKFTVIPDQGESLLGKDAAISLGIVKFTATLSSIDDYKVKYPKIFSDKLGKSKTQIKLTIKDDVRPVAQPYRRVPLLLRDKLEEHLSELERLDVIEKVTDHVGSEWINPAVIVPKKDGKIRLCIDMRRANEAIVRHQYPVPTVEELIYDMNGAQYFSKLDMRMGFHQFELHPDSRDITTFTTHLGLYRYKRLNFGITSAAEIYQKEISKIIQGLQGVANLADDIIVHATTREEHDRRLCEVFSRLEQANMTLNQEKCVIGVQQLDFLGHVLSSKGIDPDACKVEAVKQAAVPKTVGEMKSFLGLTSYVSKFIPHYSHTTDPLRKLITGKDSRDPIVLEQVELKAFDQLKADLSNSDTLSHFDVKAETLLYTDASPVGLGAILVQVQNSRPKVVCYASRALSDVESRYMQFEKEALGVVWAVERFHHYLFGCKFKIVSDCEPLGSIYGNKNKRTSLRVERWQLRLQAYDFEMMHVKGPDNIADPLSRLLKSKRTAEHLVEKEDIELYVRNVVMDNAPSAVTPREIEEVADRDEEMSKLRQAIQAKSFDNVDIPAVYKAIQHELCVIGRLVLRGHRIIVPKMLRLRMIDIGHEGHSGINGTKRYLRTRVWWPGIDSDIERYVKQCHDCQLTGQPLDRPPIRVTELPKGPWEHLALDFLGPLANGKSILVLTDYYSRWNEIKFMSVTKASDVISWLQSVFYTHGYPLSIKSDNGPQFISREYGEYCEKIGVKRSLVTPRWAEANGEVERQNRSLMRRIQMAHSNGEDYESLVMKWLFAHRNTPHSITGKSPSEMLFGRKVRTKLPGIQSVFDDIETRDRDTEVKHKMVAERNRKYESGSGANNSIEIGSSVLVKRDNPSKCQTPFHENPFTVVNIRGSQVTVKSLAGRLFKRNISHIRPYCCPPNRFVGRKNEERGVMDPRMHDMIPLPQGTSAGCDTSDQGNETSTGNTRPDSDTVSAPSMQIPSQLPEVSQQAPLTKNAIKHSPPDCGISSAPQRPVRIKTKPRYLKDYVTSF
mgnify:FL=1